MPGPLGIKDDIDLTDEQRCTLRYIEDFDLRRAVEAAVKAGDIRAKERRTAELELKRFLGLAYLEDAEAERVAPPPKVDAMWHQFLLDSTRTYTRFSYRVFGRFFHHESSGDEEHAQMTAAAPKILDYFEEVDEDFWQGAVYICWPPPPMERP